MSSDMPCPTILICHTWPCDVSEHVFNFVQLLNFADRTELLDHQTMKFHEYRAVKVATNKIMN